MRIYISIPISGHDLATQRAKALEIAEKIRALGKLRQMTGKLTMPKYPKISQIAITASITS